MELSKYMYDRLLHGHIINSNNQNTMQLIELDTTGNVLNTYFYVENPIPFSHCKKLAVISEPLKIVKYKYAMKVDYDLYMFLLIHDIATYNFTYKLYDLYNMTFMWKDLTHISLLNEFNNIGNYAHNRLIRLMASDENRPAFLGEFAQKQFNNMQQALNSSLKQYINNINIVNDIQNVSLQECELIYTDANGILTDLDSHNKFNITDKWPIHIVKFNNGYIKQYRNIYLMFYNGAYVLMKLVVNNIYIICTFDNDTINIASYIQWQLNYALLSHQISTAEYHDLLMNITNIFNDFRRTINNDERFTTAIN